MGRFSASDLEASAWDGLAAIEPARANPSLLVIAVRDSF